jgi:chitooligosaccharide deacetylase
VAARIVGGVGRRTINKDFADIMALGCHITNRLDDADGVFLTFDDSPNSFSTNRILDALAQFDIPATFFCIGNNALRYPDIIRRIASAGHEIANHTMTHPNLYRISPSRMHRELSESQAVLERDRGGRATLFRAPAGRFRWDLRHAEEYGLKYLVKWDVSPDWFESDARRIAEHVLRDTRRGSIIVLHDGLAGVDAILSEAVGSAVAESIMMFVPVLIARGVRFLDLGHELARNKVDVRGGSRQYRPRE